MKGNGTLFLNWMMNLLMTICWMMSLEISDLRKWSVLVNQQLCSIHYERFDAEWLIKDT